MTFEELLESIRTRENKSLYGIGTAAAYVAGISGCFSAGGLCPTKVFKLATDDLWQKEIAEAGNRLTYCDESTSDSDFMQKSVREGTDITSGAILEYDCVLSSKRKDRDGDVIEQKGGLDLDLKQPALWQHLQLSPIGKLVKVLDQDEFTTKCRYALADTELGRDAAVLVKFGALRKSIGFKPSEFSPIEIVKGADGRDVVRGWHIKKAVGMEGSLVSIPANADANILATYAKQFDGLATAFSRGELKADIIKHWAKGIYDLRPVQASGFTLETKTAEITCGCGGKKSVVTDIAIADLPALKVKRVKPGEQPSAAEWNKLCDAIEKLALTKSNGPTEPLALEQGMDVTENPKCPHCKAAMLDSGKCSKCEYVKPKDKAAAPPATKELREPLSNKMYGASPYPVGSYEAKQWQLRNAAKGYLESKGVAFITDSYVDLVATFDDSAVVCVSPYSSRNKNSCYQIAYSAKDGGVEFSGEPVAVELQTQIVAKALESFPTADPLRVKADAVRAEHPAKLAKALIAQSCVDPEAVAAVREVARIAPVHDLKSAIDLDSLFAK